MGHGGGGVTALLKTALRYVCAWQCSREMEGKGNCNYLQGQKKRETFYLMTIDNF